MSIAITEIVKRSEQGVTRPFLCRASNGSSWFVKGLRGVGAAALRAEWICGKFAKAMHLPIPAFAIAEVDEVLVAMSAVEGANELGQRYAFSSQAIGGAQEITFSQARELPLDLQARVLLFDWWIRNEDRILGPLGGNPNILTTGSAPPEPWLIDHHTALDAEFQRERFWNNHIFADARGVWTEAWRRTESKRLESVAGRLSAAWQAMPDVWLPEENADSEGSVLEQQRIARILLFPIDAPAEFWNVP